MHEKELEDALLDAVDRLLHYSAWRPAEGFNTEVMVDILVIRALQAAYNNYLGVYKIEE